MNTGTRPAEGAGGSRSQAAGELTLGLLSGEKRRGVGCSAFALLWERACSRRRPDSRPISFRCTRSNCGSWLASEGVLPADQFLSNVPSSTVGASLLAKNLRAPRGVRLPASSLTSIASKLAPTGRAAFRFSKCPAVRAEPSAAEWICTPSKKYPRPADPPDDYFLSAIACV
jgi:hypothetical protein